MMALITAHWGLDGLILFAGFFFLAYLYTSRNFNYWKKRGVKEVTPLPFVGNFLEVILMKKSVGQLMRELYEQNKGLPYVGFYLFDKPFFMVRDPSLIKHILIKDFNYFPDRNIMADENDRLGYVNLFMIRNPAWKILRSKLTPAFSSGKLKKSFENMSIVGKDLDTYLQSLALDGAGRSLELKELCAKFTTDIIGITAFGLQVNSLNNPEAEFRKYGRKIFEMNVRRAIDFYVLFLAPHLAKLLGARMYNKESERFLRSVFWGTINHRIESGIKRNDLIDQLIELRETHKGNDSDLEGFEFEGDDLVAQAAVFFSAGFEAASTTMSFALYHLALEPKIQDRLRKEIIEGQRAADGQITYEMINSLQYLDMIVAETLRMYPTLPFVDRVTSADYKLPDSDVILKKGTPVYIPVIGLHHDPEYFPDPEKFDPERFAEERKKEIQACTYMPFGEGPHYCIGMRLGLLEIKLGVVHILNKYELSPCQATVIPPRFDQKSLLTAAKGGLVVNVKKITTNAG